MLSVTLLGGSRFSANGAVVRSEIGPAGRLLACYLFQFVGRCHRREKLADIFWGELEPEKARSALNTAIWRVRKMLDLGEVGGGRRLITAGNDVILEPAPFLQVDTHALQHASQRAAAWSKASHLTESEEKELSAAVERYVGPFLDGDDGDWILQERERLHCLFVRSTLELLRAAARRGEHERALEFGRRVLATDPLRESVQRDLMLLLVLNGQRAEAIRSYQHLKVILRSDLGIEPMPDTKRLYQDILSGEVFDHLEQHRLAHFQATPH